MNLDFNGKVAIVTGAGQGIGAGIARVFSKAGAKVVIATRTASNGAEIVADIERDGGTAMLIQTDVAQQEQIHRVVHTTLETFGGLDIVIHNAGVYPVHRIEALPNEALDLTLTVNLKAAFWLVQAAAPHFKRQGRGRFLFTSSVTGPSVAMPGLAHYAASKAGLNGFIRTAALEYARDNITVNGVEPGYILTPAMAALGDPEEVKQIESYIPQGHFGKPEDVGDTMLFLASDGAAYITGQTIVVDGGSTLPESPFFSYD